jgi:hypothetical protein
MTKKDAQSLVLFSQKFGQIEQNRVFSVLAKVLLLMSLF